MLADDDPAPLPQPSQDTRSEENEKAATGMPWALRWVDVEPTQLGARAVETVPVAPRAFIEDRRVEPLITLRSVVFMCVAFVLTLGTIKIMIVALIYERRRTESSYAHWRGSRMG